MIVDIKQLYTLLFSSKDAELKFSIKEISNSTALSNIQKQNIFSYAVNNNKSLTKELITDVSQQDLVLGNEKINYDDEKILKEFYISEEKHKLFGFSNFEAVQDAKKSIPEIGKKIVEVLNIYKKIAIKNNELSSKKPKNEQKIKNDLLELESKLNKDYLQQAAKIAKHELARDEYIKLFKLSKLIAEYVEDNNTPDDELAYKHAYDMVVCFGGDITNEDIGKIVEGFLKDKGFAKLQEPIHDTFATFSIPSDGTSISLKWWQNLVIKHGKDAMNLFSAANMIEAKKAELEGKLGQYIAPKDLSEAQNIKMKLTYKRADEYPKLAELFLKYNLSEELFNQSLSIETQKKKNDNLPDITIHGADISSIDNKDVIQKYHLVKLPINDPRAYILGHIVKDCQSVGGNSEKCVIDGITKENNGFYVLLKNKKKNQKNLEIFKQKGEIDHQNFEIVGQGYAWLSDVGNLTFDSWENLRNQKPGSYLADDAIIVPILKLFTKKVCETTDISRVTIGTGGKTPNLFKALNILENPEEMKEGFNYGDAQKQVLIGQNQHLAALQAIIDKKFVQSSEKTLKLAKEALKINGSVEEFVLNYYLKTESCLKGLNKGFFTHENLKILQITLIEALTSEKSISGYGDSFFTFDSLKDLPLEKIHSLTAENTIQGFREKYYTFDSLKDLPLEKIHSLTTKNAIQGFREKYYTFDSLKDLPLEKIHSLTTENTIQGFRKNYYTFDSLKDLPLKNIYSISTEKALKGFRKGYFTFDNLKDLEDLKIVTSIKIMSNVDQNQYFPSQQQNIDFFKEVQDSMLKLTLQKIQKIVAHVAHTLCLHNIIEGHKEKYFKINDLVKLKIEKIILLVNNTVINGYEKSYFKFDDLVKLKIEKIKLLVNCLAIKGYERGYFKFDNLVKLEVEKIKLLTSEDTIFGYRQNYFKFDDLVKLEVEKIKLFTSEDAISGYEQGYFKFDDLVKLEIEKIKLLVSPKTKVGYNEKWFNFSELKDLSVPAIEHLTSGELTNKYRSGVYSFKESLKEFHLKLSEKNDIDLTKHYFIEGEEYNVELVG